MTNCWANFDTWADRLARKECTFEEFANATNADAGRMARTAARRKTPPNWMSVDDVKSQIVTLLWFYACKRVAPRSGVVGFDPSKYRNAGAWLRWKVQKKLAKELAKARGENLHTRRGPGAPEYLSKTGELPEMTQTAEAAAEVSIEVGKLRAICKATRDFVILDAIVQCLGDRPSVVEFLTAGEGGFKDSKEARAALSEFEDRVIKKRGVKRTARAAIAA